MTDIILPASELNRRKPHEMYREEFDVASKYANVHLLDVNDIVRARTDRHVFDTMVPTLQWDKKACYPVFYHGWMMDWNTYHDFNQFCKGRGHLLTNNLDNYVCGHHFDAWYDKLEGLTPKSTILKVPAKQWKPQPELRPMIDAVLAFQKENKCAVIIKDSVKSLKHDWNEACFIPADANPFHVAKVVSTFLTIKTNYDDFQGHFVVRKFENLKQIGTHPKSGMPISQEYRAFVLNGKVISQDPYWEGDYDAETPPESLINEIAKRMYNDGSTLFGSNLFTIDTAQLADGSWTCIEVGDGQVSSIPPKADKDKFFRNLFGIKD